MLKILMPFWIISVVVATYAIFESVPATLFAGTATLFGCAAGWRLGKKRQSEVTSTPERLPWHIADPVLDDDGFLPPTPNMGELGEPYRGPTYFNTSQYRKD